MYLPFLAEYFPDTDVNFLVHIHVFIPSSVSTMLVYITNSITISPLGLFCIHKLTIGFDRGVLRRVPPPSIISMSHFREHTQFDGVWRRAYRCFSLFALVTFTRRSSSVYENENRIRVFPRVSNTDYRIFIPRTLSPVIMMREFVK